MLLKSEGFLQDEEKKNQDLQYIPNINWLINLSHFTLLLNSEFQSNPWRQLCHPQHYCPAAAKADIKWISYHMAYPLQKHLPYEQSY